MRRYFGLKGSAYCRCCIRSSARYFGTVGTTLTRAVAVSFEHYGEAGTFGAWSPATAPTLLLARYRAIEKHSHEPPFARRTCLERPIDQTRHIFSCIFRGFSPVTTFTLLACHRAIEYALTHLRLRGELARNISPLVSSENTSHPCASELPRATLRCPAPKNPFWPRALGLITSRSGSPPSMSMASSAAIQRAQARPSYPSVGLAHSRL